MKTVKILANPKNGLVFNRNAKLGSDGKVYGWFLVESQELDMSGAIVQVKRRTAVKAISEEAYLQAKDMFAPGSELSGKIIIKEALTPFFDGQAPKTAGAGGEVCTKGGKAIYRQAEYTSDLDAQDSLIAHDNVIAGSTANQSEVPTENLGKK